MEKIKKEKRKMEKKRKKLNTKKKNKKKNKRKLQPNINITNSKAEKPDMALRCVLRPRVCDYKTRK